MGDSGSNSGVIRRSTLVIAVAGILALGAGGASADGTPGAPLTVSEAPGVADWTGFYVGGKLGGAWSDISWTQDVNLFTAAGAVAPGAEADFGPSGFAGGIIGGGNLQIGRWIFGGELSFSGTDLSQTITSPFFPATDTFATDIDWLATVEGRIGYTWNRFLMFGKGGWAGGNASLTLVRSTTGVTASTDSFVDGWTIGGGVELISWSNVILGLEYDYVNLNLSDAASCPLCAVGLVGAGAPATITGDATISSVMVRASYLFMPED
jgi:outer membrane immunogenic protein